MRYFYCLACLLLLHVTAGFGIKKDDFGRKSYAPSSTSTHQKTADSSARSKRSSHSRSHRGLRQVGYFETSGENGPENDFGYQEPRDPSLRDEEKLEGESISAHNQYEKLDNDASNGNTLNGEASSNVKLQLFSSNDHFTDADQGIFRKERQVKRYDSSDTNKIPEKTEINKNFMNLLKWNNKNKDFSPEIFPPGVQKNEAYPINDDVADFAIYMNKGNKRRTKGKGNANNSNNPEGRYEALVRRPNVEYTQGSEPFDRNQTGYGSNYRDDTLLDISSKIKKDTSNIIDDLVFSESGPKAFEGANYASSQRISYDPYPSLTSLLKKASADEGDSDQQEMSEEFQQGNSGVVGDVIREKTIILPEPLVFNTSHVVSSFVYTMIPFRSPLLNLLENDKHSKYIMIKIDPVLQPSKRISLSDPQLRAGHNTEHALEQNVMKVIDKLIGSDLQWDLNSVEGLPRSKQKGRVVSGRHYRELDEEPIKDPKPSTCADKKGLTNVIS